MLAYSQFKSGAAQRVLPASAGKGNAPKDKANKLISKNIFTAYNSIPVDECPPFQGEENSAFIRSDVRPKVRGKFRSTTAFKLAPQPSFKSSPRQVVFMERRLPGWCLW
ncbi:hypothetical protein DCM91_12220 [Chitinophaga costaii]|nr:hypothetical protein DCM91_12220 [Chitinophaga costaii]